MTRAALLHMGAQGSGAIVNNASVSALTPTRNEAAYSAAKAGVIALTKSGALEFIDMGGHGYAVIVAMAAMPIAMVAAVPSTR